MTYHFQTMYLNLAQLYTLLCLICLGSMAHAQLPSTNIYSLDLKANEQKVLLNNLTLLTDFNITGYNNQPHFVNSEELLITSDYSSSGLTDILHLRIADQSITRITKTEQSEYSPTMMSNGIDFSVVRQELSDSDDIPQSLWSYPLDRSGSGQLVIEDIFNIGYHVWATQHRVALFLVEDPSELMLYDTKNKNSTHIAYNVGRCLKVDKKGNIYYVEQSDDGATLRAYDIYLGRSRRVAKMLEGQVDFELLPNGHIIAAQGAKLMTFIPSKSAAWSEVSDLSEAGISNISRIASTHSKIAIVTSK